MNNRRTKATVAIIVVALNVFIGLSFGSNENPHSNYVSEALTGVNPDLQILFNETKTCVKELWANSEAIKNRFSIRQIAGLCSRKINWARKADSRRLQDGDSDFLTKRQRAWLEQLRDCRDLFSCVCPTGVCSPINPAPDPESTRQKRQVPSGPLQKAVRKEIRSLTEHERLRFFTALNAFKADNMDGRSKYDILVYYHQPEQAPGAHWGPAFLPWHREFLRQMEVALRAYDFEMAIPYWDNSLDEGLPQPEDSIIWTESFLGASELYLTSGPFKDWRTLHSVLNKPNIVRNLGKSRFGSLYRPEDFELIMTKGIFDELTSCVDPYFELVHGAVHLWIGGHMADIPISPNDPLFFLHHAFVDQIWEEWRQIRQTRDQRQQQYPPAKDSCNSHHYENKTMKPFPKTNKDGLSNLYTDIFYTYEPRPTCFPGRFGGMSTCGGPYLFCDPRTGRCLSKVKAEGNCTGFEGTNICLEGMCVYGKCTTSNNIGSNRLQPQELNKLESLSRNNKQFLGSSNAVPNPFHLTKQSLSLRPAAVNTKLSVNPVGGRRGGKPTKFPAVGNWNRENRQHGWEATANNLPPRLSTSNNPHNFWNGVGNPHGEPPLLAPSPLSFTTDIQGCHCTCPTVNSGQLPKDTPPQSSQGLPPHEGPSPFPPFKHQIQENSFAATAQKQSRSQFGVTENFNNGRTPVIGTKEQIPDLANFPTPATFLTSKQHNEERLQVDMSNLEADNNVWFSITVLEGLTPSLSLPPVPFARIQSVGDDYIGTYNGHLINKGKYPYHKGSAYVKVRNPQINPDGRSVAQLSVQTVNKRAGGAQTASQCRPFCRQRNGTYVQCNGLVTLDVNLSVSDPIPFTPYPGQVMYLGWKGQTQKSPDYFLFICPVSLHVVNKLPNLSSFPLSQIRVPEPATTSRPLPGQPRQVFPFTSPQIFSSTSKSDRFQANPPLRHSVPVRRLPQPISPTDPFEVFLSDTYLQAPNDLKAAKVNNPPRNPRLRKAEPLRIQNPFDVPTDMAFDEDPIILASDAVIKDEMDDLLLGSNNTEPCRFLRFDNFMLVGFSELVREGITIEECKNLCRSSEEHDVPPCASITFWNDTGSCVVNSMSRRTNPDLFLFRKRENCIYYDYFCDLDSMLEE